jgi:CheY-like chemotaxis protein
VVVRVEPLREAGEEAQLRVTVVDTGIGIAPEAQARLFNVFTQASVAISRRYGGTGLGLAISKRLVERMGGRIGLSSEAGRGSTFWFELRLPVVRHEAAAAHQAEAGPAGQLSGTVLLAEDNPINRLVAQRMLAALGLEVVTVNDGRAAVERYQQGGLDLVLMDMEMPELDGPGAARAIRVMAGARQVPIVALTASALAGDRQRCLDAGMNDFLSKPYGLGQLRAALVRWLPRSTPSGLAAATGLSRIRDAG